MVSWYTRLKVPTIIVTIATSNIYFGLLYVFSKGEVVFVIHPMFGRFGQLSIGRFISQHGTPYGFSCLAVIWLLTLLVGWFVLRYTQIGRNIYAIGGSEVAAERVGINVFATRMFVFGVVGVLSGIAAIVHAAIVQSAIPNIIVGQELNVIKLRFS